VTSFHRIYKILVVADQIATRTPGFANEIQGVYGQQVDGRNKLFTYVIKE
jgi:hypothetical protein